MSESEGGVCLRDLTYMVNGRALLNGVSLDLDPGSTLRIVGRTNAGKSTLGRVLAGLIPQALSERDIEGLSSRWSYLRGELRASTFAVPPRSSYVPANPRDRVVFPTVHDELLSMAEYPEAIRKALEFVGLEEAVLDQPVDQLSGGMLQRLALAQVFLQEPRLLVLDEILEWLDPDGQRTLEALIRKLTDEGSIAILLESDAFESSIACPALELTRSGLQQRPGSEQPVSFPQIVRRVVSTPSESVLASHGVRKRFPGASADRDLELDFRDLDVRKGEYVGITGKNGVGKSVLATILAGIEKEDCGAIVLNGRMASGRERMRNVGYLSQFPDRQLGLPRISHALYHSLPAILRPSAETFIREHSELQLTALITSLTIHEKRIVILGILLARRVQVLIIDEPTWGADKEEIRHLAEALGEQDSTGLSVLVISHHADMLERWCGRVETIL